MNIYFHSACFDGVSSAALASWIADHHKRPSPHHFQPVDYDKRSAWEHLVLDSDACVVDFLYHPRALWWWDHHATPFLSTEAKAHYQNRRSDFVFWDPNAPSCAGLILHKVIQEGVPAHLRETTRWADKLDSARYSSSEEAVIRLSPARAISLSFGVDSSANYQQQLIHELRTSFLEDIVNKPPIRARCREAAARYASGVEIFRKHSTCERGIVLYDITVTDSIIIDGMIPYFLFPEADYALGLVRTRERLKVTCNRNPWRRSGVIHLGQLFTRFRGGGHQDIGAALFSSDDLRSALDARTQVVTALREDLASTDKSTLHKARG